jgi:glycerol dehydrogenase-like iron-containing ADH family enzyme
MSMSAWPLPRIIFQELSTVEEKRPVALLTSESVWPVLSDQLALPVVIQADPDHYSRTLFDYLADNLPSSVQAIYVVGQGAPLQAGKVIAARNNKPLIIVPTAMDSDMMFTPYVLLEEQAGEESYLVLSEPGPATEIIIDWATIRTAPETQRGAGIVDVLSIVTALLDWRYAAQKGKNPPEQRFSTWAAGVAAGLASQAIKSATAIGQGHQDALRTLLDLMMIAVQLGNQLGHTRASQGSEHYLAQILAGYTDPSLSRSELVGPCILFVAALHGQDPAPLREALVSAGVRLDQLRSTDVRLALDNLTAHLDQAFPYSILNDLDPASDTVSHALLAAGLAVEEDTWELPQDLQSLTQEVVPATDEEAQPLGEAANPPEDTGSMPPVEDAAGPTSGQG